MPAVGDLISKAGESIGGFLSGGGGITNAFVGGSIFFGLSAASAALFGSQPSASFGNFTAEERDRQQIIRSPVSPWTVIYGTKLVSGPLFFGEQTGTTDEFLHIVLGHAAHACDNMTDLYVGDTRIGEFDFDGSNIVDTGDFNGFVRWEHPLGSKEQAANTNLVADVTNWTTAHRLRGIAHSIFRLKFDVSKFPGGLPNLRALVRGKLVWNPRKAALANITSSTYVTAGLVQLDFDADHGLSAGDLCFVAGHSNDQIFGEYTVISVVTGDAIEIEQELDTSTGDGTGGALYSMEYSQNPILCILDYLVNKDFGLRTREDELNLVQIKASATTCEEQVALTPKATDVTRSSVANTIFNRSTTTLDFPMNTGSVGQLTTTGTLPAGASLLTDYFVIARAVLGEFSLAPTLADAVARTNLVTMTDAGSGTHTFTRNSQLRYTMNGAFSTDRLPIDIMEEMATTIAGAIVPVQGAFEINVAAATTATITIDNDDVRGEIEIISDPDAQSIFNRVVGVFSDPAKFHQPGDFPPVKNALYRVQDGFEITRNIALNFTDDSVEAQRIAKIFLERSRQGIELKVPCKMNLVEAKPWEVATVTIADLGFSSKEFRITDWSLVFGSDGVGPDLTVQEESSNAYDWALGEETALDNAPDTNLPSLLTTKPPTGLALSSGTGELFVAGDGTVISRIRATWTAGQDIFIESYLILARNATTGESYQTVGTVTGDETEFFYGPVEDGDAYDLKVIAVNVRGVKSDETAEILSHTVVGKSEVPGNVSNFSAQQNGNVVTFRWNQVSDADLAGYEIRYLPQSQTFAWSAANALTKVTRGTLVTNAALPPGAQTVAIKALDTSGNESATATTYLITISVGSFEEVTTRTEHSRWVGTKTNFIVHDVSGRLIPDSQNIANADGVFASFVRNPFDTCRYEAKEIDLGFDANASRITAVMAAALGPGETTGVADPNFEIDYRDAADSYDGFETWTVGTVDARYIKARATIDTTTGVAYLSEFKVTIDGDVREERFDDKTIAIGGTSFTFAEEFHKKPNVQLTADGGAALFPIKSSVTVTGFTQTVYNASGTDVGGVTDAIAKGV